jgi:hypothetical protein
VRSSELRKDRDDDDDNAVWRLSEMSDSRGARASCTAACRAAGDPHASSPSVAGPHRSVIPPDRARTKAASGHLDERLPPTTAELLENSDKYELHDQIRQNGHHYFRRPCVGDHQ